MTDLLVNLAAIRAEFNQGENDLIKQFMPLVGFGLSQIRGAVVSEAELQDILYDTMQFRIPFGALRLLINRATNRRYDYLIKNPDGTYSPNRQILAQIKFQQRRNEAQKHQKSLSESFQEFCKKNFNYAPSSEEVENYFFEILFDIAPMVVKSIIDPTTYQLTPDESDVRDNAARYRVYKFVTQAVAEDGDDLRYIEEFIQGAVMAESFFYTEPSEALNKMRDVKVFLDTPLLISVLKLSEDAENSAISELIDLLKTLKAKVRCFRDSRNELHGILWAIYKSKESGKPYTKRPGDIGDILNRRRMDLSDIAVYLEALDTKLQDAGITIEDRPSLSEDHLRSIDEAELRKRLRENSPQAPDPFDVLGWDDKRLNHDIDCVRATFQLRDFRGQSALERCQAIFITTNSTLTRVCNSYITEYLEEIRDTANTVPVCLSSNVFTMLMWLKTSGKKNSITKDRLVANSIAALTPSAEVWSTFISKLKKLLERGEISVDEFDYISNALETRTILMTEVEGQTEDLTVGTTIEIKEKVMRRLLGEKDIIITDQSNTIEDLNSKIDALEKEIDRIAREKRPGEIKIENVESNLRIFVRSMVWLCFRVLVISIFIVPFAFDVRDKLNGGVSGEIGFRQILNFLGLIFSVLSLFVIAPWRRRIRLASDQLADRAIQRLTSQSTTQ